MPRFAALAAMLSVMLSCSLVLAQPPQGPPTGPDVTGDQPGGGFPGGGFPPGGPGGFQPPAPPIMVALDADGDGEISADEVKNAVAALKSLDKNADGELANDELMPSFPGFGGPGFGGPGGPGGPMRREKIKVLDQFDADKDGMLNQEERALARKFLQESGTTQRGFGRPGRGPGRGGPGGGGPGGGGPGGGVPGGGGPGFGGPGFGGPGFGGPGFGGGENVEAKPGKKLAPEDVPAYVDQDLYDANIIRTLFLEFENEDWEEELEAFRDTDAQVPARLIADGEAHGNVGVRFRGNTSYMMVPRGRKRSLNLSIDYVASEQRLHGYRTLNLLNSHSDPSFMRNVLYNRISREYMPALEANFVRVVINGESWGLYVNEEQFNSEFLKKWYGSPKGARWKVPPNFSGSSGLSFLGDDVEEYKRGYNIKTKDDDEQWQKLVNACRVINQFYEDQDLAALEKVLNVDQALWFLAIDNVFTDGDGYFSRASDYNIYLDSHYNRVHLFSRDNNEVLREPEGPGFRGGRDAEAGLDPLSQMDDPNRALVRALLSHPQLKARYLAYVRTITQKWLDWNVLGPIYQDYYSLIESDVKEDTRMLGSYDQFVGAATAEASTGFGPFGAPPGLKTFVDQRRDHLLHHQEIAKPYPQIESVQHQAAGGAGSPIAAGEQVVVRATMSGDIKPEAVVLYYCTEPAAPFTRVDMYDDGQHHDGSADDGVYGAVIPGQPANVEVRYYVESRSEAKLGTASFLPVNTEIGAYRYRVTAASVDGSGVVINELMATNSRTAQDPDGEFDDWIELYNRSDVPVDLSDMYLSDSVDQLKKWALPRGTVIPAKGYLVVWADEDSASKSGLHANFKLSKNGETLSLVDSDAGGNGLLDQIRFERLSQEVAFGRYPCGADDWQPLVPSPGEANRVRE